MSTKLINVSNHLWKETLQKLHHDIYHLPEYVALEAKRTNTYPEAFLKVDGEKIFFVPYLLRKCNHVVNQCLFSKEIFDVVSPYGYPGILLSEAALNTPDFPVYALHELKQNLKSKDICSAFLRLHPILNNEFYNIFPSDIFTMNGETVSIDLNLSESQIWSQTKKGHRNSINKCKRLGMRARVVAFSEFIDEFTEIQLETMKRVGASEVYFTFNYEYFLELNKAIGQNLHLCIVEYEDQIACAGLYTECCGIVQSALGGTRKKFIQLSPSTLETDYARYWAKERGNNFLHLGGGVGGTKDGVYAFKSGFSKQKYNYLTLRLILNKEKYYYLVNLRAKSLNTEADLLIQSQFFPAYRSS